MTLKENMNRKHIITSGIFSSRINVKKIYRNLSLGHLCGISSEVLCKRHVSLIK